MIRNRATCFSTTDKTKYPFDEVLLFFTVAGGADLSGLTVDSSDILLRELVPVSSLDAMTNRKEIYLHSIEFAGYDTAEKIVEKPEESDKEFANEFIFGNMLTSSWQPNFCRPTVRINGVNITSSISRYSAGNADFTRAIGLPLPFCLAINKVIKEPRDIEIFGALAQKTESGFRNYPLLAILNFWHSFN
jgi:hypothetical protein